MTWSHPTVVIALALVVTSGCRQLLDVDDPTVQDAGKTDAPKVVDAPTVCTTEASLPNLTLGTPAMPETADWFYIPTTGANTGRKTFFLAAALPGGSSTVVDAFVLEVVRPANGFVVDVPINFSPEPDLAAAYTARSFILGDFDSNAMTYQQLLVASNGAVVFTTIGETSGSAIDGNAGAVSYKEVNETTHTYVTNGCMTALEGLAWHLTQMTMMPLDSPRFSPGAMRAMSEAIARFELQRAD